ncbi:MAG: hypothetical protein F6K09_03530, partial [Merismopedia sp. SIO2A8]|nr:hypothetical protein [Merismopedia sp. SIO2A8]
MRYPSEQENFASKVSDVSLAQEGAILLRLFYRVFESVRFPDPIATGDVIHGKSEILIIRRKAEDFKVDGRRHASILTLAVIVLLPILSQETRCASW